MSERWPDRYAVTPAALQHQLRHLLRRGFRGVTFAELVGAPSAERVFAATFDDAYRSVREWAAPFLASLGVPGTVFACSDLVGARELALVEPDWRSTEHRGELTAMDWDDLGELADRGWEIGSHTRSHPKLTELDDARLGDELAGSRFEIERRLGAPCGSLAYPYGDFDSRVVAAAAAAGYEQAATLFPGRLASPHPLEWPRVAVGRHHSSLVFRLRTARLGRAARTIGPAAAAIDAVRRRRGRAAHRRPHSARA